MLCCVCRGNFWKCSSLGLEKRLICFIHMQRIIQHSSVRTLVWMSKLPVEPKECCTAVTSAARTVSASSPENELSGIKNGTDNNAKRWIMHFEDLATFVIKIPSVHWVSQRDGGVCAVLINSCCWASLLGGVFIITMFAWHSLSDYLSVLLFSSVSAFHQITIHLSDQSRLAFHKHINRLCVQWMRWQTAALLPPAIKTSPFRDI